MKYFYYSDWYNILNRVHRANQSELGEMKEESANIKNAVVSYFLLDFIMQYLVHSPKIFKIDLVLKDSTQPSKDR